MDRTKKMSYHNYLSGFSFSLKIPLFVLKFVGLAMPTLLVKYTNPNPHINSHLKLINIITP